MTRGLLAERLARPLFALPGSRALRARIHQAGAWWLTSMLGLLPDGAVRGLSDIGALTVLDLRPDSATVWSISAVGHWRELGHKPLEGIDTDKDSDLADALATLPGLKKAGGFSVLLDPEWVLERSLVLPDAEHGTLHGLLCLDLDRFMPVDETTADMAFRIAGRNDDEATVQVVLACIRSTSLTALADRLTRHGLRPARFVHWSKASECLLSFQTPSQKQRSRRALRRTGLGLGIAALTLAGLFALPWVMIQSERHALEADLALVRQDARRAALARQKVQGVRAHYSLVADHLTASPALLPWLARLTDALPDDAHLDHVSLRRAGDAGSGLAMQLKGSGTDSTKILRRLGMLPGVDSARHGAPVRIDPSNGREAFTIDVTLIGAGEVSP